MINALVGHTGFVGGNLARQMTFDHVCNSKTIESFSGLKVDRLVFSGAQAKKWWANANPEEDWAGIERALSVVQTMRVEKAVLISTIDVLPNTPGLDEGFEPEESDHAYGVNRLRLERAFRDRFDQLLIVRLPALFGSGLKKNVIFDLIHGNMIDLIQLESRFQYYDLERLASDIEIAEQARLRIAHFFPEPLSTREIVDAYFPQSVVGANAAAPVLYDFRTRYGHLFGSDGPYLYTAKETLDRLGTFLSQEAQK